ncbi:MAG: branched-chain amino acid ABC transporter permease [Deltaproteobacteria bacterium]|nr:branched-chain amino acid ABC transporter permease [Deltaproteobacteria bacterium]MBW1736666.1 branched-chain amino acid ABC transporter permease [Deltaproteobacteria bacterium]MBW1910305.1 branched-chain amino acid ABC transporter permease [Deltaproteobacteria bacterium]MBW2032185.1 branched-chain amino acid ABC transporter permease [Deltaproteobacteria bacterium]MBW2114059.1 branched-chain amino acid ABC transporter permease [Deltaproteobacteria bacterium]
MSRVWLPCGDYHQRYAEDQGWWQTNVIKGKMILLLLIVFVVFPLVLDEYWIGVANMVGYTILGALGVQLLIGYAGLITLGHAAFIAVGAYTSTLLILKFPWPQLILDWGLAFPISILVAAIVAGLWSVLFGLPSARVKGFYLILTTMAAQFITVDFILTQYVSKIGGRGQAFSLPPGTIKIGPWVIDTDLKVYFVMITLLALTVMIMANLLRSRVGRAWIAIRDNDIAAETLGINIIWYKLLNFFVAGFIGGIAGAFWVSNCAALSPEHFSWFLSLWLVGVILIGGAGIEGAIFGSIFMVVVMELLQMVAIPLSEYWPKIMFSFAFVKEMAFGLAICAFLIYEPRGLSYRWWQVKNYFNLWPFSY